MGPVAGDVSTRGRASGAAPMRTTSRYRGGATAAGADHGGADSSDARSVACSRAAQPNAQKDAAITERTQTA